jgi:hypothetical protein
LELKSYAPRKQLVQAQVEALTRPEKELATLTGFEINCDISQFRAISTQISDSLRVNYQRKNQQLCRIAQIYAVSVSDFVRKIVDTVSCASKPVM